MERASYEDLVENGGRPWYPLHLLEEISENPSDHRELLRYAQTVPCGNPNSWKVFTLQLNRWILFQRWQANRRKQYGSNIAEHTQWTRRFLLNRHKYTAPVEFEFDEDPMRQDQLTTWIEYLTYEYTIYTRYNPYKRRHKWYDRQWKKVVDSGVLRSPQESRDVVLDSLLEYRAEEIAAHNAVESAKSAVSSAQQAMRHPSQLTPAAQSRLEALQSRLESATQTLACIKRRHGVFKEFLNVTDRYRMSTAEGEHHATLLQWIRDQIPLIQLEMEQAEQAKVAGGGDGDARRGKSPSTRERDGSRTKGAVTSPEGRTLKRKRDEAPAPAELPPKRPRRSVRHTAEPQGPSAPAAKRDMRDESTPDASTLPTSGPTDNSRGRSTRSRKPRAPDAGPRGKSVV